MVRPGVEVTTRSAPPTRGAPSDTGVAFFAGLAAKGPAGSYATINNMSDFERIYGSRTNNTLLYDACDAAFRVGVSTIHVSRAVGPAAAVDTHTFNDAGALASLAVDTIGPGVSGLKVAIVAGAVSGFAVQVTDATTNAVLETSPDFALPTDAVAWTSSDYVRFRALGANAPAIAAAVALAGGTDDRASITDTQRVAAVDVFPKTLGPGQVAYPGGTTTAVYQGLLDHAQRTNRFALLDAVDTANKATLTAAADGLKTGEATALDETYGMFLAPWHVIQGVVSGTTRTVPPSAIVAGLIANSDGRFNNPNRAAAGANGESPITLALSQPEWSDTDRQTLNDHGVNVFRNVYGAFRLYGFRTLANSADANSWAWESAAASRLRMVIATDLDALGEEFLFDQIDGRGLKLAEFKGAIVGKLQGYWGRGALYGDTASAAFSVDTGSTVNTAITLANNELHAVIGLRVSPFAELAKFEVVKVPITEAL